MGLALSHTKIAQIDKKLTALSLFQEQLNK